MWNDKSLKGLERNMLVGKHDIGCYHFLCIVLIGLVDSTSMTSVEFYRSETSCTLLYLVGYTIVFGICSVWMQITWGLGRVYVKLPVGVGETI